MAEGVALSVLRQAGRFFRKGRPISIDCIRCQVFQQGDIVEVSIPSFRCAHDAAGECIMCDYGIGAPVSDTANLILEIKHLLDNIPFQTLLFSTNGSVLDDRNLPQSIQYALMLYAAQTAAKTVIFETHIDSITKEKLDQFVRLIPNKHIILEVGLESADPFVQRNCYLKPICLSDLSYIIRQANLLNIEVQCNVMLGAPFLSVAQQMNDAEKTIRWCLSQKASVVVFPVNIKPFTTLWYLHDIGGYSQLSHWALVLLLSRFSAQELQQIDIAWYGNRINGYPESSVPQPLLPTSCPICNHQLQLFFNLYMQCVTGEQRAVLLRKINCTDSFNCSCRERFLSTLVQTDFPLLHSQVYMQQRRLVAALKGDFPDYFSRL